MSEFQHVDSAIAARWHNLADRARATLIAAGIPAFDEKHSATHGGARVEVDTGDDGIGGIYLTWTFSEELAKEIGSRLLSQDVSHPVIRYSGKVQLAMRDAIIAILGAAGFSAGASKDDDMRPLAVSLYE